MKRFWVLGLGSLVLCALGVFACASGDDDDDGTQPPSALDDDDTDDDSGDDDADDDDADDDADDDIDDDADDDADDDTGPSEQECVVIWSECLDANPISDDEALNAACGEPPSKIGDPDGWLDWKQCTAEILQGQYHAADECGFSQGCEGESHLFLECKGQYWDAISACAESCGGSLGIVCYEECEASVKEEYWCSEL